MFYQLLTQWVSGQLPMFANLWRPWWRQNVGEISRRDDGVPRGHFETRLRMTGVYKWQVVINVSYLSAWELTTQYLTYLRSSHKRHPFCTFWAANEWEDATKHTKFHAWRGRDVVWSKKKQTENLWRLLNALCRHCCNKVLISQCALCWPALQISQDTPDELDDLTFSSAQTGQVRFSFQNIWWKITNPTLPSVIPSTTTLPQPRMWCKLARSSKTILYPITWILETNTLCAWIVEFWQGAQQHHLKRASISEGLGQGSRSSREDAQLHDRHDVMVSIWLAKKRSFENPRLPVWVALARQF